MHIAVNLPAGARIGPYEIVAAIGAGGMGEVYRARDTRLGRDVAIKVLPGQFSSDAERLMRFEREARTLASLNHPNIAQIFGTEREADVYALAMEFVDGEDLSHILARGALQPDEAVSIARQIAEALEAAHAHGVIHRDLKPANVKVRTDGTVKVLDFGLAKTIDATDTGMTNHPTLTSPAMTQVGVILGTAAYMSPEQAKGRAIDRGSDLWAFGAVFYEMLCGRAAFAGETVTDVLAAIVTREPDWGALPASTPPGIRRLLRRCLERDRRRRLADAGEARFQLEEAISAREGPAHNEAGDRRSSARAILPWAIAAVLGVAAVVLATRVGPQPGAVTARYNLDPPPKAHLSFASRPAVSVSADGRTIVFVASMNGVDRLFIRRLDSFDATEIRGSENASSPAISPDGRSVAFCINTRLVKVSLAGGPVTTLATIVETRGVSWDEDASILYVPKTVGGVWRIPSTGGQPMEITKPATVSERTHRYPQQLPGGAVIFTIDSEATPDSYDDATIAAQMPDGSRHTVLTEAAMARYVSSGHLLFARGGTLFAVPFDPKRAVVMGTPVEVLHEVAGDLSTGAHHFAASASGTLVYISGRNAPGSTVPAWVRPGSDVELLSLPAGGYADMRISRDGQQAAMTVITDTSSDVWVHHFQRRTFTKVTFAGTNVTPIWSRDGSTLYYSQIDGRKGSSTIMRRPVDGSRQAEPIATLSGRVYLNDLTSDGRSLVINLFGGEHRIANTPRNSIVAQLPLEPNATVTTLVDDPDPFSAALSRDGRWIAYVSNRQVFVRPLTGSGRWQVSTSGGEEPKWAGDGRRLYYRNDNIVMFVEIDPRAAVFQASAPVEVANGMYNSRNESGISYDVDPKQERLLVLRPANEAADALSLRVITNWTDELKQP
jgi:Tol biopolymer transport system component